MSDFTNAFGKELPIEELILPRSISIAKALELHPYARILSIRRNATGEESIVTILDVEVPSSPVIDIRQEEEVVILCSPADNTWPEVLALRLDFPKGLSHTNARDFDYPVSICYSEERFIEVKHNFNAFQFVEKVRKWFELTALNITHAANQPLEPFFFSNGYAILKLKDVYEDLNQTQIFSHIPLSDSVIKLIKGIGGKNSICCLKFTSLPLQHGAVRKQPTSLKDLLSVIKFEDSDLLEFLKSEFNALPVNNDTFPQLAAQKLAFLAIIPKLRGAGDSIENIEPHLFITNKTISDIGIDLGIWEKADKYYTPIVNSSVNRENVGRVEIEYYSVIFDFDKKSAAIYNKVEENNTKYALIGVGALGSQVMNIYCREGFGKWFIIDHDTLFPHNLARHYLSRHHIGKNKAESCVQEMNQLLSEEDEAFAEYSKANFLINDDQLIRKLEDTEAIIDMSTSISVERKLGIDMSDNISSRRISSFLNPRGTDLVLLAEDINRETRLDQIEMQYYRHIINSNKLTEHLIQEDEGRIRYASNSCREITTRLNQENVSMFSAIVAKAIRKTLINDNGAIKIWQYNLDTLSVESLEFELSKWLEISVETWTILIDEWVYQNLIGYRRKKLPKETGGILVGAHDFERKILYIVDSVSAPKDSIEENITFIRGIEGLTDRVEDIKKKTRNQINYIGEWHSHPANASIEPSTLDVIFFAALEKEMYSQGYPTLMMIVGDAGYKILISEA